MVQVSSERDNLEALVAQVRSAHKERDIQFSPGTIAEHTTCVLREDNGQEQTLYFGGVSAGANMRASEFQDVHVAAFSLLPVHATITRKVVADHSRANMAALFEPAPGRNTVTLLSWRREADKLIFSRTEFHVQFPGTI